jgi:hypothetical protein
MVAAMAGSMFRVLLPVNVNQADLNDLDEAAASIGIDGLTTSVRALDGTGIWPVVSRRQIDSITESVAS